VLRTRYRNRIRWLGLRTRTLAGSPKTSEPRASLFTQSRGDLTRLATSPHQASLSNGCSNYPPQTQPRNHPDRWTTVMLDTAARSRTPTRGPSVGRSKQNSPVVYHHVADSGTNVPLPLVLELDELHAIPGRSSACGSDPPLQAPCKNGQYHPRKQWGHASDISRYGARRG